jgi:hypothetical protein
MASQVHYLICLSSKLTWSSARVGPLQSRSCTVCTALRCDELLVGQTEYQACVHEVTEGKENETKMLGCQHGATLDSII